MEDIRRPSQGAVRLRTRHVLRGSCEVAKLFRVRCGECEWAETHDPRPTTHNPWTHDPRPTTHDATVRREPDATFIFDPRIVMDLLDLVRHGSSDLHVHTALKGSSS